MENQKISVIIPMYNEELVIEECYKRLKENITKLKKSFQSVFQPHWEAALCSLDLYLCQRTYMFSVHPLWLHMALEIKSTES